MKTKDLSVLEDAIVSLIRRKPFFGYLLMTCRRYITSAIPTAGVSVTSKGLNLYVNLDFLDSLSEEGRIAVLEHEMLHLLHMHPARFERYGGKKKESVDAPNGKKVSVNKQKVFNVAADCAINQYLKNLNEIQVDGKPAGITLNTIKEITKNEDVKAYKHMEYYYSLLKDSIDKKIQNGEMSSEDMPDSHDDHSMWEETDLTKEQAEKKIEKHLRVAKEASEGRGLTSAEREMLASILDSKVDWKAQLRNFVSNAEEVLIESTRKKRNKRYGVVYPGTKAEPKFRLGVCVDTSGSISQKELFQFFTEIKRIADGPNVEVYVVEADSEVKNFYKYDKRADIKPKGGGGTAYNPAIKKCMELACDAICYFGDGDTADSPENPKVPFIWAMVRDSAPPATFGRVIRITTD